LIAARDFSLSDMTCFITVHASNCRHFHNFVLNNQSLSFPLWGRSPFITTIHICLHTYKKVSDQNLLSSFWLTV
jgi:hypothetical protein